MQNLAETGFASSPFGTLPGICLLGQFGTSAFRVFKCCNASFNLQFDHSVTVLSRCVLLPLVFRKISKGSVIVIRIVSTALIAINFTEFVRLQIAVTATQTHRSTISIYDRFVGI